MTRGGLQGTTTVVSGTLTDKQGKLVWNDSKQGVSGITHRRRGRRAQPSRVAYKGKRLQALTGRRKWT